ncbi:uncharacterized protein LOC131317099 [Rhododendron vialii]|uniref:uncharacterized protein LOC131317099 n=1 Tax=Rhododendron vialii TaxID=182163 RepID=UPI00265EE597|nr:uncharacterized protein LOC131317099 [Rhododendron vialii]
MRRQRERMQVARFLYGASSTYDPVSQLLGSRDLPSLSEVFSRLCQSSVSVSTPALSLDGSALASAVSGSFGSSFSRGCGRGRDSGFSDRGRDSGFGGLGHGVYALMVVTLVLVLMEVACQREVAVVTVVISSCVLIVEAPIILWSIVIIFTGFLRLFRLRSLRMLNSLLILLPTMW